MPTTELLHNVVFQLERIIGFKFVAGQLITEISENPMKKLARDKDPQDAE
jgi:hypothetical protein